MGGTRDSIGEDELVTVLRPFAKQGGKSWLRYSHDKKVKDANFDRDKIVETKTFVHGIEVPDETQEVCD